MGCREAYEPTRDELPKDFPWDEYQATGQPLYRPKGCRSCRQLGFVGRQGILELCVTTDAVRQLAHDRSSSWEIRQAARKDGMRTLPQDAWLKVIAGITTIEEVARVTKGDRI
jgi:general secretion pathway protein E/type IV pilus assembly protein PilB